MASTVLQQMKDFIARERLAGPEDRILLAVSGGSDSMTLADLFGQAGLQFAVAHCNFQLRGEDSLRDENFVREYCRRAAVPCYVIRFDTAAYAREHRLSIQESARTLRYEWFEHLRCQEGYDLIATAHHRTDHVETLLLNFFKGSGIHGLHGILAKNGRIIRPMLFLSKTEVWQYVEARGIAYVDDVSNDSLKYKRNFLRHRVVPLLEEGFPGVEDRLAASIARYREAGELYDQAVAGYKKQLLTLKGDEAWIPVAALKQVRPLATVTYEVLRPWGFSALQCIQVVSMLEGPVGKTVASSTHRLIRDRAWLIITPLDTPRQTYRVIEAGESSVVVPEGTLTLGEADAAGYCLPSDPSVAAVDARELETPLVLRRWKQGDYFYPLGMRKKKKLSRFFIDEKVPLHRKQQLWVLVSGERVVWIVGMRLDDRFKVTPATRRIVEFAFAAAGTP